MTKNICAECNAEVSMDAETCPECGFPFATLKPVTCPGCSNLVVFASEECPVCSFPFAQLDPALFKTKADPETAPTPEAEAVALAETPPPQPEAAEPEPKPELIATHEEETAATTPAENQEEKAEVAPSPKADDNEQTVESVLPEAALEAVSPVQLEEVAPQEVESTPLPVEVKETDSPSQPEEEAQASDLSTQIEEDGALAVPETSETVVTEASESVQDSEETQQPVIKIEEDTSATAPVAGTAVNEPQPQILMSPQLDQLKETVEEIARSVTDAALGVNGLSDEVLKQKQEFADMLKEMAQSLSAEINTALAAQAEAQKTAINEISGAIRQINAGSSNEKLVEPVKPSDTLDYILLLAIVILVFSVLSTFIAAYAVRLAAE